MATAGKISIDLEAMHASFTKGIDKANESLKGLGETAESIKGIVESALAFAGVEMGVSALKEVYNATTENVVSAYRLSSALGITTQSLQQLQAAGLLGAGLKADEFNGVLQKLTKSLAGAEDDGGKAAAALTALGLSGDALKGAKVDEAFTKIAEQISKVEDPAKRAGYEIALFGRSGQQLDPLFQQGAEGIAKAAEEANKFGTALSDTDAAKVMEANEAMEKVGLAVQGVENQLVVALAPVLESTLNKLLAFVPAAETMRSGIITALRYVAEGVGMVVDAWHVMQLAGEGVSWAIVGALELLMQAVNGVAEGIVWVTNKLGGHAEVPQWITDTTTVVDNWRQQIQSDMATTVDQLAHLQSEKWGKFFDDIQTQAQTAAEGIASKKPMQVLAGDFEQNGAKIKQVLAELQKQVDEFGQTASQKKIAELKDLHADAGDIEKAEALSKQLDALEAQKKVAEELARLQKESAQAGMTSAEKQVADLRAAGANNAQLEQAKQLQANIDAMTAWKKEQEEAAKLIDESRTPLEKYQDQIQKIEQMYKDGLLSDAQADDALAKAAKGLDKSDGGDEIKKAGLETRRFDFRLPEQPQKEDAAQKALAVAEQHLKESRDQSYWQEQLYLFGLADQANADTIVDLN